MPSATRKASPAKKISSPAKASKPAPKTNPKRSSTKKAAKAVARKAKAAPEKLPRRAIFVDVENTSNEEALARVIDGLKIDRAAQTTELYAFGNWRAVGQSMSRNLARLGATLVHTSPVTGVKDWSDLWIAVAAGRWIALASPGDILEIVSNDKAFEAVGDAAANSGILFRRVLHRHSGASAAAAAEAGEPGKPRRRRRRGGRGRRGGARKTPATSAEKSTPRAAKSEAVQQPPARHAPAPRAEPADSSDAAPADGHGASHDQILSTIRRLTGGDPARWVNLDAIANALKSEGFTRRPGSPRLVVRLRRMKDIEVQANGMVRVVG